MQGPGSVISFSVCLSSRGKQQSPVYNNMAHTHTDSRHYMQKMCQWKLYIQWGENYHHLRRQTNLIHCISNVQVVTAAVHHNKCEVSITSCQVHLGRYNSTVLHSGMYTCACGCYVVAMCMCLFFVTYILEQTQHPLSLVLDGKNSKLIMPCAATGTRGQATV